MSDPERLELRDRAVASLRKKRDFHAHVMTYVLVNAVLVVIWAMTGAGYFWPVFPILGWGIGVFFNGWDVYARQPSEERIRRETERLGSRQRGGT